MIKNVKQTIQFNAVQALATNLTPEQSKFMDVFFTCESEEESREAREDLITSLSKAQKAELAAMKVESPTDKISVHMRLGNLLFDLYRYNVPMPQAPLPKRVEENRRSKFADLLDADEFESLPPEILAAAKEVMNDDEKWNDMHVFAWVDLDENKKRFIPMIGAGVNFYKEVVNAACALLTEPEVPETVG